MFKSKLWVWLLVLFLSISSGWVIEFVSVLFSESVVVTVNTNGYLGNINNTSYFKSASSEKFEFLESDNTGADILIMPEDEDKTIDGYTKYSSVLSTGVVGVIKGDAISFPSKVVQMDLKAMLECYEGGYTWSYVGVASESPISIAVPYTYSPYYNLVEDLFYYALNNYEPVNETTRVELETRVNALMTKCEKCSMDMSSVVSSETDTTLYLVPEFAISKPKGTNPIIALSSSSGGDYRPVYIMKTVVEYYNVYISDACVVTDESILEYLNDFEFYADTLIRGENRQYNINSRYNYLGNTY